MALSDVRRRIRRKMPKERESSSCYDPGVRSRDREAYKNAVVVLTGASSGIGRELALLLAGAGAHLVLAARDLERLAEVTAACRAAGAASAEAVIADIAEEAQCRALIERAAALHGRLDVLINNAGMTMWSLFRDLETLEPFRRLIDINYLGAVYCTHAALPLLEKSRGRIVAVASLTGKTGVPTRTGYAASKHAMIGFFDSLRIELLETGITVTVACPDYVATPTRSRGFGADGGPVGDSPVKENEIQSAKDCAEEIFVAAARRQRELLGSTRGKIGQYLKLFWPALVDRIALRAVQGGR